MFSTKTQLKRRTPENGTNRKKFLSLLVDEYLQSSSYDAKCQVLANLANFAYDPINYCYIRDDGVLDIFLYVLKNETSDRLLQYSCAGICNLCVDPVNAEYILRHAGVKPIITLLESNNKEETLADAITILIYLWDSSSKTDINQTKVVELMHDFEKSQDKRIANLAAVFLQDIYKINCGEQ